MRLGVLVVFFSSKGDLFIKGQNRNITICLRDGQTWEGIESGTPVKRIYGTFVEDE